MKLYEIIAIVLIISFFIGLILSYCYKRKNNIVIGECACCKKRLQKEFKRIRKQIKK